MCRNELRVALVCLLGGVLLIDRQALAGGCDPCANPVMAFPDPPYAPLGYQNCPLGGATVTKNGLGKVEVTDIGGTGTDGVQVWFGVGPVDVQGEAIMIGTPGVHPVGAYLDFELGGRVDQMACRDIMAVRVTRVFNVGTPGLDEVAPSVAASIPGLEEVYHVAIMSNGVPVWVAYDLSDPVYIHSNGLLRDESPPVLRRVDAQRAGVSLGLRCLAGDVSMTLEWRGTIKIKLPDDPTLYDGDTLIFTAGYPSAPVNSVGRLSMRGKDIDSITVTHESATILREIPTLSQWGMIILALLLATAGTIVLRRRSVAAALE